MGAIARKKNTGEPGNPGEFGSTRRTGSGLDLGATPAARPTSGLAARDELARTSRDPQVQRSFLHNGDTVQREALMDNPHLAAEVIEEYVDSTRFNPAAVAALHRIWVNMTPEVAARIRTW